MPGRSQSGDLRFLKTVSCKRLPQRKRKTNLQAAKYWTRNNATGMLNQNLNFSCVNGESYYKKAAEESGGRWVFMQVCFAVWSVWNLVSFLVTPIPKRLRGGNTASGCACPSLFLSLFLSCSLSLMLPLVSHFPSSPPFPLHLGLSLLLSSLRALQWCGPPTDEQG